MAKTITYNIEVKGTTEQAQRIDEIDGRLKAINESRKKYIDLLKQGVKVDEASKKAMAELTIEQKKLMQEKQKLTKSVNNEIKANNAAKGSYNELAAANVKLGAEIRSLSDIQGKNKKQFQNLTAQYNKNNATLKKLDATMGNHQRNVGDYQGAIKGAFSSMGLFSREMMIAQQAMNILKATTATATVTTGGLSKAMKITFHRRPVVAPGRACLPASGGIILSKKTKRGFEMDPFRGFPHTSNSTGGR